MNLFSEVFQLELLRIARTLAFDAVSRVAKSQLVDGPHFLGEFGLSMAKTPSSLPCNDLRHMENLGGFHPA